MTFPDVLTLISESQPHGVLETATETERQVYCTVESVSMSEAYRAMSNGLHPSFVFKLTDFADYNNEKICVYKGVRYRIIRSYRRNQGIELTAEEVTVDA